MNNIKDLSLKEKARAYQDLINNKGWKLLKASFQTQLSVSIKDRDSKEQFLYESIRAQVLSELFNTPCQIITQALYKTG